MSQLRSAEQGLKLVAHLNVYINKHFNPEQLIPHDNCAIKNIVEFAF